MAYHRVNENADNDINCIANSNANMHGYARHDHPANCSAIAQSNSHTLIVFCPISLGVALDTDWIRKTHSAE